MANPNPGDPRDDPSTTTPPQQTTLFHGGLTYDHTDPSGKRVYKSGDGGFYTDDPDMNSVSGFIPYTADNPNPGPNPHPNPGPNLLSPFTRAA